MQISNVSASQYIQSMANTSKVEGSPQEEAKESSAEKAAETQKTAFAQSQGLGTKVDLSA